MATKPTFRIADLSFGRSALDVLYEFDFGGRHFEVQRFGANLSMAYLRDLIQSLRNQVDSIALTNLPATMRLADRNYVHRQYLEIMGTPCSVPLCDGSRVREFGTVNSMLSLIEEGKIDPTKGIFFPVGLFHTDLIASLQERFGSHLRCGDLFSLLSTPLVLPPNRAAVRLAQAVLQIVSHQDLSHFTPLATNPLKKMGRPHLLKQAKDLEYVFGDLGVLMLFGDDLSFVKGKTVLVPGSHPVLEQRLRRFEPKDVVNLFPEAFRFNPHMNYSVLDATLRLAHGRASPLTLEEWQNLLSGVMPINPETRRYVLGARPSAQFRLSTTLQKAKARINDERPPDFAFVVHPLSYEHITRVPGLGALGSLPPSWRRGVEKGLAKLPGFTLGHVRHVISQKTNQEVTGVIYVMMSTPKQMRETPPEVVYDSIHRLSENAAGLGCKILGLGAYTKMIGDAGESINRNSPIPVTTGNSLSASATLWAVQDVVRKMGLLKTSGASSKVDGTAMIIGATGSIGRVSAKLLSFVFRRLVIVAPRLERLEELAAEIRLISPDCEVLVTTQSNDLAGETDVLITATSALDQQVVDIEKLKPGCVVCDCSRPLDFTHDDAIKRPDVLIVESGEVVLPGPVKIDCDIGLPKGIVYACLGETAVLAMQGAYEPFTLGREIDYLKVKQIYRWSRDHGVGLAAIRGHAGLITDQEIALARDLAMKRKRG